MENDVIKLYTFQLIDGRRVTYEGLSERHAFNKALRYHPYAVCNSKPTECCTCPQKRAEPVRQAGWLICRDCAGYIG